MRDPEALALLMSEADVKLDIGAGVCRDIVPRIRDASATAARVVRVDDRHLVLILEFASAEDADRVATDVGGPWMRERILPLLTRCPERSVGEVIASATV